MVAKYFHLLLKGRAARWFWNYCGNYEELNFAHLKVELQRHFKSVETDMSLTTKMYERKQNNDSFEDFYYDIIDINSSMRNPLSDPQLIEILRNNMLDEVRSRIFTYDTRDKTQYFYQANLAYKDYIRSKERKPKETGFSNYRNPNPRRVHEIEFDDLSSGEIEEITTKLNNWRAKRVMKCFNCFSEDHLLKECPEDITRFFCFRCGLEGYATPKCPNCNLNSRRSGGDVRTPRSQ